jgi:heat shock protein HslJ
MQGNRIESDLPYELASHGRLAPADLDSLLLAGEVLIGGEGPALRECVTGRVFAVATDGAYPDLAAAVEARREGPDTPLLVSLEGSIAHPAPSPGSALAPQMPRLTVQRFVNAFPGEACDRPEPVAAFANTYWRIDSLNGAALPPVDGVREPHIVLVDTPEARFRATVGCNQLLGGFTRAGDALNFQAGISTLMACPPPLDTAERALAEVLAATRTARQTGQQMVFEDKDGRVTAELTAVYLR